MHPAVFVYGTLRRGEVREGCWPRRPTRIEWATVRGRLHDLGPYPALVAGDDVVLGELWHLAAVDLAPTLDVLDDIECYGHGDVDLYVREVVECRTLDGRPVTAQAYCFAAPDEIRNAPVVAPDDRGFCLWRPATRNP